MVIHPEGLTQDSSNCSRLLGDDMYDSKRSEIFSLHVKIAGKAVPFDGDMLTHPGPQRDVVYILNHLSLRHIEACVLMYDVDTSGKL